MELSSNMIWDMALNIVGYLAAGVLSVIVYSTISNRRNDRDPRPAMVGPQREPESSPAADRSTEFVSLAAARESAEQRPTRKASAQSAARVNRGNRDDIHRIAREMIKAGASHDKIQRVLPISEAELNLLTLKAK